MKYPFGASLLLLMAACTPQPQKLAGTQAYQTSAAGDQLSPQQPATAKATATLVLDPSETFQEIVGFGGAFTASSAHLLGLMSADKKNQILEAYFGASGAQYSLCRTHMNSCDFSLGQYSYAAIPADTLLAHFSIAPDLEGIIPMIKAAQQISPKGFKLVASPWTAPPWMKDNNQWFGGKLLEQYYPTWALFFSKYAQAYAEAGIPIWAFTVENEPLGNDSHWESMHYTPAEMANFVTHFLAPQLKQAGIESHILVYDQNRGPELEEWAQALLTDTALLPHIYGTAVHWYTGTVDWFPESLQFTHQLAPNKHIIHTEGCIDAEVPHWNDDAWYWKKEATDWGYDWAKPENKHNHPKYVPTYRYARDIIGCLNNWVTGWIDWNMVLDDQGGPNHAENWCIAPILVKPNSDEVYITPLYYILAQFSKFIEPGANRIAFTCSDATLHTTALQNPNGSKVVVVLNTTTETKTIAIKLGNKQVAYTIGAAALQTIVIP